MHGRKKIIIYIMISIIGLFWLSGCDSPSSDSGNTESKAEAEAQNGLIYKSSMKLLYAKNFSVDYYEGGYKILTTKDGTKILTVPKGKKTPKDVDKDIIVLKEPVSDLYLVASGVMDMFDKLDAVDTIKFSGLDSDGWYIDSAREALEGGKMLYAGKYSKPDYELLVSENCSLAIENTMITHSPQVTEKLKSFDIPSIIEYSSYEEEPLGRVEWVKFFGALTDRDEKADELFNEQVDIVNRIAKTDGTDTDDATKSDTSIKSDVALNDDSRPTVAFFYITSNGQIQVRKSTDYVPKMISLAGGEYIFDASNDDDTGRSTMNMQLEDFYNGAIDADYLIYNSAIDGGVKSIAELLDKCLVLADFRAVKDGNVFCTTNDMYQQSMSIGYMIDDMHSMITDAPDSNMKYLFKLR
ncbi:ABC transporter substrate-binding protein [Agathobacter sp.]